MSDYKQLIALYKKCSRFESEPHSVDKIIGSSSKAIKKKPSYIYRFDVPVNIMKETKEALMEAGRKRAEGLIFWSGKLIEEDCAKITFVLKPEIVATSTGAKVTDKGLDYIYQTIRERNEFIFAQVHSHPGEAFHSSVDDSGSISYKKGFITIVVPDYGNVFFENLSWSKVFEYKGNNYWEELPSQEISKRFSF